jgi:hypothetical protein
MARVSLKVKPKTGDPTKPQMVGDVILPSGKTTIDRDFDLRDKLSELAVMGGALNPDDKSAIYGYLSETLGNKKAQKLMDHAFIFNSLPENKNLTPEEKIKSFYARGSSDPDVMEVMGRTKNLGYGVLPGFRGSTSVLNQAIQQGTTAQPVTTVNPEVQRRIMLKTRK